MKINDIEVVYPSSLKYSEEEVGSSYTSLSGKTIVDIIRTKRELEVGWSGLNPENLSAITSLLDNKIVTVEYFEPKEQEEVTKTFVVSDVKYDAYTLQDSKKIFDGISAKFLEQ